MLLSLKSRTGAVVGCGDCPFYRDDQCTVTVPDNTDISPDQKTNALPGWCPLRDGPIGVSAEPYSLARDSVGELATVIKDADRKRRGDPQCATCEGTDYYCSRCPVKQQCGLCKQVFLFVPGLPAWLTEAECPLGRWLGVSLHNCNSFGEREVVQTLDPGGFWARAEPGRAADGTVIIDAASTRDIQ